MKGRKKGRRTKVEGRKLRTSTFPSDFDLPFDPEPTRGDAILVTRAEWEDAREALVAAGVPVRADVEESWLDFAGWRVNYDAALVGLAGYVGAPTAPWSADRVPVTRHRPRLRRRRW